MFLFQLQYGTCSQIYSHTHAHNIVACACAHPLNNGSSDSLFFSHCYSSRTRDRYDGAVSIWLRLIPLYQSHISAYLMLICAPLLTLSRSEQVFHLLLLFLMLLPLLHQFVVAHPYIHSLPRSSHNSTIKQKKTCATKNSTIGWCTSVESGYKIFEIQWLKIREHTFHPL